MLGRQGEKKNKVCLFHKEGVSDVCKNREKSGHGVQVCCAIMLKMLASKGSYLLHKMLPEPAVRNMDYSMTKTKLKETRQEAIALV